MPTIIKQCYIGCVPSIPTLTTNATLPMPSIPASTIKTKLVIALHPDPPNQCYIGYSIRSTLIQPMLHWLFHPFDPNTTNATLTMHPTQTLKNLCYTGYALHTDPHNQCYFGYMPSIQTLTTNVSLGMYALHINPHNQCCIVYVPSTPTLTTNAASAMPPYSPSLQCCIGYQLHTIPLYNQYYINCLCPPSQPSQQCCIR